MSEPLVAGIVENAVLNRTYHLIANAIEDSGSNGCLGAVILVKKLKDSSRRLRIELHYWVATRQLGSGPIGSREG